MQPLPCSLGAMHPPSGKATPGSCVFSEEHNKVTLLQSVLHHGGGGRGGGGGIGGVISGGSMSEENGMVMSSVESSAYPDESVLELGLGLSLACGGGKVKTRPPPPEEATGGGTWDQYARILTAKDLSSVVSTKTSSSLSSSSSSSSSVIKGNITGSCGTKRTAEPPSSPPPPGRSPASQFVGWPPIRPIRMTSLAVNHIKSPVTEDFFSAIDKCKSKTSAVDETNQGNKANTVVPTEKGLLKTSLFVKVNMDGIAIGRKVDLSAHTSYKTLTQSLDDMFLPNSRPHVDEQTMNGARRSASLSDGSLDYVLTYEDKDGDWMLVGDVPWDLFLTSVRRLRIMRTPEANGLAPVLHTRNGKQHHNLPL